MDENDHYAAGQRSALGPLGILLLVALVAILGAVIYTRSPDVVVPDEPSAPAPVVPGGAAPSVQP